MHGDKVISFGVNAESLSIQLYYSHCHLLEPVAMSVTGIERGDACSCVELNMAATCSGEGVVSSLSSA